MKRKIEAKMKGQGGLSDASIAQDLAVGIIDKSDETPAPSPTTQGAEAAREPWTSAANSVSDNSLPPMSDIAVSSTSPEPNCTESPDKDLSLGTPSLTTIKTPIPQSLPNEAVREKGSNGESDEEGRLLAQLEAQRLAEEQARVKRRKLEERLAAAREKKSQSPILKREGEEIAAHTSQTSMSSLFE